VGTDHDQQADRF